ncbi:MAG: ATP-binding protein [Deltaproteobacteria bacterium]|nr:ATP-binding protein [Deltaproteobacteria bacterium]
MSDLLERTLAGLRAALAVSPDNGPLRLQVAELLAELGRENEAAEAAAAAIAHLTGEQRARAAQIVATFGPEEEDEEHTDPPNNVTSLGARKGGFQVLKGGRGPTKDPLALEPERDDVDFSDVGGLDELKDTIRMKIVLPFQKPEVFARYGKKRGGGMMLYGPPGCGKTLLARATAGEVGATFMNVAINEVLDMWFGNSEAKLSALFDEARRRAPAVLFFDEVEAIGASRQQLRQGPGRTLVNQLLAEMDGVDSANDRVLVMAATNAPWHVDSALLRPGRFDRVVFVPPPDDAARGEILRLHLRDRPVAGDLDMKKLVAETDGLSGADLEDLIERAVEGPLKEALLTGTERDLGNDDLIGALDGARASTSDWFSTAKNYATFANSGGLYDDLVSFIEDRKKKPRSRWWRR